MNELLKWLKLLIEVAAIALVILLIILVLQDTAIKK